MTLVGLGIRNLSRNPLRTALTVLGMALAFVAFVLLRTVVGTWDLAGEIAAKDRVATRHRLSFVIPLPKSYVDVVRQVEGVRTATWMSWFGGKESRHPALPFASFAVDPPSFLEVFDEVQLTPAQRSRWLAQRQGVILGPQLATQLGLSVGDRFHLTGTVYPGEWPVTVSGIFNLRRKSFDPSALLMHWEYLNQALHEDRRERVGWVTSRVDDAGRGPAVAAAIDRTFAHHGHRTRTMSERDLNLSFVARFASLMRAIQVMSGIVLLILGLILANTIAMGVRERRTEFACMRALGFLPAHLKLLVMGEAACLGMIAGLFGIGAGAGLINGLLSPFVEQNMGGMFPFFRLDRATMAVWRLRCR
jgi:putative ABC transport system permease protein